MLAQRGGGAERVLIDVANALSQRGYDVEIVTHEYQMQSPVYEVNSNVIMTNLRPPRRSLLKKIIYPIRRIINLFHSVPVVEYLSWLNRHGAFWRRLGRHLDTTQPDVAIAFMPPAITALSYARTSHQMLRIASTHNLPRQDYENKFRWDPSRLDRKRRFHCLKNIDKICVLLPEYADYYSEMSEKIEVVPNFVKPVENIIPPECRRPVIISLGRLENVKRHDIMIMAWKKIQDEFPEWSLEIFGEGGLRRELSSLIKRQRVKRVSLMGHRKDIQKQICCSSILAHPASHEGFPLAVCEALAAGTPVVGFSNCSGLNHLVTDGVNGILVDPSDRAVNFAAALKKILRDFELRRRLSLAGPGSVEKFSPDNVIDKWEDIIH